MKNIKKGLVCTVLIVCLLCALSLTALADAYSAPSIVIDGPSSVTEGESATYTVTISGTYAGVTAKITAGGAFESKVVTFSKMSSTTYNAPTTATGSITVKADSAGTGTITVNTQVADQDDAAAPKNTHSPSKSKDVTVNEAATPTPTPSPTPTPTPTVAPTQTPTSTPTPTTAATPTPITAATPTPEAVVAAETTVEPTDAPTEDPSAANDTEVIPEENVPESNTSESAFSRWWILLIVLLVLAAGTATFIIVDKRKRGKVEKGGRERIVKRRIDSKKEQLNKDDKLNSLIAQKEELEKEIEALHRNDNEQ